MPDKDLPQILAADYLAEARSSEGIPGPGPPEIAIAGRSNVGKSTLLNRLAGRRSLARTSKTPGRTRGIIFYDLAVRFATPGAEPAPPTPLRLVDLPGYGYARVSQDERRQWQTLIEGYVERRLTLRLFVVLVDARRGVEEEEGQLVEWLATVDVPHLLVVTKTDKLSATERGALPAKFPPSPGAAGRVLLVSGQTGEGVDALWRVIRRSAQDAPPPDGNPT